LLVAGVPSLSRREVPRGRGEPGGVVVPLTAVLRVVVGSTSGCRHTDAESHRAKRGQSRNDAPGSAVLYTKLMTCHSASLLWSAAAHQPRNVGNSGAVVNDARRRAVQKATRRARRRRRGRHCTRGRIALPARCRSLAHSAWRSFYRSVPGSSWRVRRECRDERSSTRGERRAMHLLAVTQGVMTLPDALTTYARSPRAQPKKKRARIEAAHQRRGSGANSTSTSPRLTNRGPGGHQERLVKSSVAGSAS